MHVNRKKHAGRFYPSTNLSCELPGGFCCSPCRGTVGAQALSSRKPSMLLLCRSGGWRSLCGCVGVLSMTIFNSWTLNTAEQDQDPLYPQDPPTSLLSGLQNPAPFSSLILAILSPLFFCLQQFCQFCLCDHSTEYRMLSVLKLFMHGHIYSFVCKALVIS